MEQPRPHQSQDETPPMEITDLTVETAPNFLVAYVLVQNNRKDDSRGVDVQAQIEGQLRGWESAYTKDSSFGSDPLQPGEDRLLAFPIWGKIGPDDPGVRETVLARIGEQGFLGRGWDTVYDVTDPVDVTVPSPTLGSGNIPPGESIPNRAQMVDGVAVWAVDPPELVKPYENVRSTIALKNTTNGQRGSIHIQPNWMAEAYPAYTMGANLDPGQGMTKTAEGVPYGDYEVSPGQTDFSDIGWTITGTYGAVRSVNAIYGGEPVSFIDSSIVDLSNPEPDVVELEYLLVNNYRSGDLEVDVRFTPFGNTKTVTVEPGTAQAHRETMTFQAGGLSGETEVCVDPTAARFV